MSRISMHLPTNVTLEISIYKYPMALPTPRIHGNMTFPPRWLSLFNLLPASHEARAETANEGDEEVGCDVNIYNRQIPNRDF